MSDPQTANDRTDTLNDISGIILGVMGVEQGRFVPLHDRFAIAAAVWDAGYRLVPTTDQIREAVADYDARKFSRTDFDRWLAAHDAESEPSVEEWSVRAHEAREKAMVKGYTPDHDAEHGIRHLLNWAIDYARRGRPEDSSGLILSAMALLDDPEGEPSDVQPIWERAEAVEAARLAYQEAFEADYDAEDCIVAALRAAGGV